MAKKTNLYFETFQKLGSFSHRAAESLLAILKDFDPATIEGQMASLHAIEHAADEEKHKMMKQLAAEFVTPIEREDIIHMASEMDDVTDKIEDVLMRIYMYNIQSIRGDALLVVDVIMRSCAALQVALEEFPNFRKLPNDKLHESIVLINTLEEEGDALYIKAMRTLYTQCKDPIEVVAWSETFDKLEECCDACEHVANVMESIIMKNS